MLLNYMKLLAESFSEWPDELVFGLVLGALGLLGLVILFDHPTVATSYPEGDND
jgi:hypothetical protein